MRSFRLLAFAAVAGFVFICAHADLPPAFSDVTLDAAKKQVDGTDKVVVIKFTAEWCPPCKAMDKTTWRDDKVVEWVKSHGVALQVDVDKDQKTAMAYNIEAMPTMVMLRGGKEIARTLGYMNPAQTLSWMELSASGKQPGKADPLDTPVGRLVVSFGDAMKAKKYADATRIADEIWNDANMSDALRRSGVAARLHPQLAGLLRAAPDAKPHIQAIRDETEKRAETQTPPVVGDVTDWLVLNEILGDDERTLAWFDRAKESDGGRAWIQIGFDQLAPLLARRGKSADLAAALPADPAEWLQKDYQRASEVAKNDKSADASTAGGEMLGFELRGARVYACLVAAKRIKEANEIAEGMLQLRDTPTMRVALVGASVEAGVIGPGINLWLDEAQKSGLDVSGLRKQVEALRKP